MDYPVIYDSSEMKIAFADFSKQLALLREQGSRIVTTNGCFDLLHSGHLSLLKQARALGDLLIVGLNSDASVAAVKGTGRPLRNEIERAMMLLSLRYVDYVIIFDDLLPNSWLAEVRPFRHCKAGDYNADALPERDTVISGGGEIVVFPLVAGQSTSRLVAQQKGILSEYDSCEEAAIKFLLDRSNLLRRIAYECSAQIVKAAEIITQAFSRGNRLQVCTFPNDLIVEFSASMLPVGQVADFYQEFGRTGDILLLPYNKFNHFEATSVAINAISDGFRLILIADEELLDRLPVNELVIIKPACTQEEAAFVNQAIQTLLYHLLVNQIVPISKAANRRGKLEKP